MLLRPEQIHLMRLGLPPVPLNAIRDSLAAIGIPDRNIGQIASVLEKEDPNGTIYTDDVLQRVAQSQQSRFGAWSGNEDSGDILAKITAATADTKDDASTAALRGSATGQAWTQEGQQLWNDSQKDDDGFFSGSGLLSLALPLVLTAMGMPAGLTTLLGGGTLGSIGAGALIGAGTSLLTGGNPLQGALFGAVGGGVASHFGGASNAAGTAASAGEASVAALAGDVAAVPDNVAALTGGDGIVAGAMNGTPTNAQQFLLADGSGATDVPQGMLGEGAMPPAGRPELGGESWRASDWGGEGGGRVYDQVPAVVPATAKPGIIESAMGWAKDNKELALGGAQLAFGAMKGVGDAGAARELADRKAAADLAVLEKRKQDEMALQDWKRRFTQSGSYFAGKPAKPSGQALTRADGSPVFGPNGIIAAHMGV